LCANREVGGEKTELTEIAIPAGEAREMIEANIASLRIRAAIEGELILIERVLTQRAPLA